MYCQICEPTVQLLETIHYEADGLYYQEYICLQCNSEYVCSSQSGDMVQENLELELYSNILVKVYKDLSNQEYNTLNEIKVQ